jgi:hypothetical protein
VDLRYVPEILFELDTNIEYAAKIDRILEIKRAAATKAGGQGIRYTCRVGNNQIYLFHDRDIWFIEV